MLTETGVTGSDDWWLMRLGTKLGMGLPRMARLRSYRDGSVILPDVYMTKSNQAAMLRILRMSRTNTAELISGALVDRQNVLGFRTAAPGDDTGDQAAVRNWKRSQMPVRFKEFLRDVADYGEGFMLTSGPSVASPDARPMFLTYTGWNAATEQDPAMPWLATAGITVGYDVQTMRDTIVLYRPGYMRMASKPSPRPTLANDGTIWSPGTGWSWDTDAIPLYTPDNPLVRYSAPGGFGEWENHIDAMDRINADTRDRLIIVAMQAYRQRAIEGKLPRTYPMDHPDLNLRGKPIDYDELFQGGPAALWILGTDAKMWESGVVDITPLLAAKKDDFRDLAAVTSTPIYLLTPDATNGSAEGAALAREAFRFKVTDRNTRAGSSLALSQGLAFQAQGDTVRAESSEISTIWGSVLLESAQSRATAAQAAKLGGASQAYINREFLQMTPEELAQELVDKSREAFEAEMAVPAPPTIPTPAGA
jgi:hypothetical protein